MEDLLRRSDRVIHHITRRIATACLAASLCSLAAAQEAPKVKLSTTMGDIVVEVYPDKAPQTVANFLQYVKDGFYNGTIFHRVINGFMIQGGGMDENMVEKKTRAPVAHEGRLSLSKGLHNQVGYLAMARTNDPHSATAQFFINVVDNSSRLDPILIPPGDPVPRFEYRGRVYENEPRARLENAPQLYGYTVFGKVVDGMDVVDRIKAVPTGSKFVHENVPLTPVVINSATLLK
jgi:peptidyl-prolyl cis-trans isomerase A (cyclophilin A)